MMKRVLIVDDDRQMVRTLSDVVQLHGWEAHGVYSGEDALTSIEARPFAIVLMDIRMDGMSGVEVLRAMKRIRPGIPIILMTAHTASEVIADAEREGALHVLRKPVPLPALVEMLDAVVA